MLAKPLQQEAFCESEIYEVEECGNLMITRKRDGWKVFVSIYKGKVKLYTDGLRDITKKLPHIAKELQRLKLPSKTLLVGEAVAPNEKDHLGLVQSVLGSSAEKALKIQEERGKLHLALFDVVFYNGCRLIDLRDGLN